MESRDIVRPALGEKLPTLKERGDLVELMTIVQSSFFEYARSAGAWSDEFSSLYWEKEFEFGPDAIRVQCYNSSWTSARREVPGTLIYPVAMAEKHTSHAKPASAVISVIHHPLNWFQPSNAQLFREHLERTADLVITGHEHVEGSYEVAFDDGATVRHLEGAVLQEHGKHESSFQALVLEPTSRQFKRLLYTWKNGRYERANDEDWKPFHRNQNLATRGFGQKSRFLDYLEDCGATFSHPRKAQLVLSDIFVYPDMRVRSIDDELLKGKNSRTRIGGREFFQDLPSRQRLGAMFEIESTHARFLDNPSKKD